MRVLIIDDQRLFAEAVRGALEEHGVEVVGVAGTGEEGVAMAGRARPDVVLLDLGLPDQSGVEVGRMILSARPSTKVLALSASSDGRVVEEVAHAGFHGYLGKDTPLAQLVSSIGAVREGQTVISPGAQRRRAPPSRSGDQQHADLLAAQLTARERQVLGLLVQGSTSVAIGRRLSLSPNTVRTHVQSILTKLQVHSRFQAAAFAARHGIVKPPVDGDGGKRRFT